MFEQLSRAELEAQLAYLYDENASLRQHLTGFACVDLDIESQSLYTALFENMPEGVSILDTQLTIRQVNRQIQQMHPQQAPLQGHKCYVAYQGLTSPCADCPALETLRTGQVAQVETFVPRTGDAGYWIKLTTYPLYNKAGEIGGIVEHVRDITRQKESEQAYKQQYEREKSIVEATLVGTWEWHIPSGKIFLNERWAGIAGYTLAELEPTTIDTWYRLLHPEDRVQVDQQLEQHFTGQCPHYDIDCRIQHKDGHWVWIRDRGKVIEWDAQGRPVRMFGTHTDISDRKQSEAQLRQSEQRYRTIFDESPLGIIYYDTQGRILNCNKAFVDIIGSSKDRLLQLNVLQDLEDSQMIAAVGASASDCFNRPCYGRGSTALFGSGDG